MRQHALRGLTFSEFAISIAAMVAVSAVLHPVIAQARFTSHKRSFVYKNSAFEMYATDVEGGLGDFEGKPILLDGLDKSVSLYRKPNFTFCTPKASSSPATGCMPITRFKPDTTVVEAGTATSWSGTVSNASSGSCSVMPSAETSSVTVNEWSAVPVSSSGTFWLISGAVEEGVGTVSVQTNTGAEAANSVLVVEG